MPFTTYLAQKLVAHAFGGVVWTPPATLYVALSTSAPTAQEGTGVAWNFDEVAATNGYARVADANNGTDWTAIPSEPTAGYTVQNGVDIDYGLSTGAWASGNTIGYFGIFDAATGGNLLAFDALKPAITVPSPGYIVKFAAGELTVTLT